MSTLHKLKQPATHLMGSVLLAVQAVIGIPFLLTLVRSVRHWDAWFSPKNPR